MYWVTFVTQLSFYVETCDEKFFTFQEKCSIINVVLNQIHESVFNQKSFRKNKNSKKENWILGDEAYAWLGIQKDMLIS